MSVSDIIAQQIIDKLEKGIIPWKPTWILKTPMNFVSKRPYTGINMLLLDNENYEYPYYLTFRQVSMLDAHVKEGECGHIVTYMHHNEEKQDCDDDENLKSTNNKINTKKKAFLRYYRVWNISQTTLKFNLNTNDSISSEVDLCAKIINSYKDCPDINHQEVIPCYNRVSDVVKIPKVQNFKNKEAYYSTLFHELIHSTGHQKRLKRKSLLESHHFGSEEYSLEELVAEIGAYMLCSKAQISNLTNDNAIAYIQGWLNALKNDHQLIFTASRLAQEANNYILT